MVKISVDFVGGEHIGHSAEELGHARTGCGWVELAGEDALDLFDGGGDAVV